MSKKTLIISLILSLFLILAFNYQPGNPLPNFLGLEYLVIYSSLAYLIYHLLSSKITKKLDVTILSLIFSLIILIGKSYTYTGAIKTLFSSLSNLTMSLLSLITFFIFIYYLIYHLFNFLDHPAKSKPAKISKIKDLIFNRHPFLYPFIILLLISIIYLIAFYPGTVAYDGFWQLDFYFGLRPFSDHHPAIVSMLMGNLMKLGTNILNNNFGIFLYIIIQVLINASVYAYVLLIMQKTNTNINIRRGALLFFALTPFINIYAITYIKDTIFYLVFLLIFTYQYYHLYYLQEYKISNYLILLILYTILFIYRNTGFYIALFSLIFILVTKLKSKKSFLCISFILIYLLALKYTYQNIFLPAYDIAPSPTREMLSIPLQQTGRLLKYHYSDLKPEEKTELQKFFNIKLEKVGKIYDPNRSDNVKFRFLEYPTHTELKAYFQLWLNEFIQYPFTYVEATLNNTYGYFYLDVQNFIGEELGFYTIASNKSINTGYFSINFQDSTQGLRDFLYNLAKIIASLPVISLLYGCGIYTTILLISTIYLVFRKKYQLLAYLSSLYLVVALCLVSPVNGHMRYLFPVVVSTPLLIAILSHTLQLISKQ